MDTVQDILNHALSTLGITKQTSSETVNALEVMNALMDSWRVEQ